MAIDNGFLNSLQLYQTQNFSGLVEENMLARALMTEPHKISNMLSYVMGNLDTQYSNTIDALTKGVGRVEEIENREYKWKLQIDSEHSPMIQKAEWAGSVIDPSSTTQTPGLGNTAIKIWLAEKWFGVGAILAFDKRDYQVRVQSEPYQDGANFVYTVVIANGDYASYVPPSQFAAGKRLSREFSAYGEYSDEGDIVNFQSPTELKNHLTTMRLTVDVTGSAAATRMVIEMKDPKSGKKTALWADMALWRALRQWYEMRETQLVYSKFNGNSTGTTDLIGTNGRPIYIGSGLMEQIAPAHTRNYTSLTLPMIDDFLFDLSYNKLGNGQRKFVALGGEMATKELDRCLKDAASGYNLIDTKFITGSGNDLTFGGQFTTYKGVNGMELTIKHLPLFDNVAKNRQLHPVTKRPLESYKMLFLDYGMRDGRSNIRKIVRKGRENVMWYVCGSTVPTGVPSGNMLRSNAKDGYSIEFLSEEGLMIEDPSTTGMLQCTAE